MHARFGNFGYTQHQLTITLVPQAYRTSRGCVAYGLKATLRLDAKILIDVEQCESGGQAPSGAYGHEQRHVLSLQSAARSINVRLAGVESSYRSDSRQQAEAYCRQLETFYKNWFENEYVPNDHKKRNDPSAGHSLSPYEREPYDPIGGMGPVTNPSPPQPPSTPGDDAPQPPVIELPPGL